MLLNITGLNYYDTASTSYKEVEDLNACDVAYCIKPLRASWDLSKEYTLESFYTNIGIDNIKFSFTQASHALAGLKVNDEIKLQLVGEIRELAVECVITEIAYKNGFVIATAKPKVDAKIEESAVTPAP